MGAQAIYFAFIFPKKCHVQGQSALMFGNKFDSKSPQLIQDVGREKKERKVKCYFHELFHVLWS